MKRIKMKHDNKDRIICISEERKNHTFYYQPAGTSEQIWLFTTKRFSHSVFMFFYKYGRCLDGVGFSLTLKELYEFDNNHNPKISKIFERIPMQVEYVLRENAEYDPISKLDMQCYKSLDWDYNRVA